VTDAAREQLGFEIGHWRLAVEALRDLDMLASPTSWTGLEEYLRTGLRSRLRSVVAGVALEAAALDSAFKAGTDTTTVRNRLLRLRMRYLQLETVTNFFGDALATRANPPVAAILRGLDTIAADSMDMVLRPLGLESPPALVYFDKGLGASILRAGVRLWDQANPSPVAAIKVTRHNASHPTALLHETGHQVNYQTGWNTELAAALRKALTRYSSEVAQTWEGWSSEVGADVYAFALAGWAPLPALANVVDGATASVFRMIPADPHPFPYVRVMFNAAMCSSWFGSGPWDRIAASWSARHSEGRAPREAAAVAKQSMAAMADIVTVCTKTPMQAFGGRPLTAIANPQRVSPQALDELANRAGASLLTSSYLARREPIRILAWLATRTQVDPANALNHRRNLLNWLATMGGSSLAKSA